jgi:hypothetical protein
MVRHVERKAISLQIHNLAQTSIPENLFCDYPVPEMLRIEVAINSTIITSTSRLTHYARVECTSFDTQDWSRFASSRLER